MVNRPLYIRKYHSGRLKEFDYNVENTFDESKILNEIIGLSDSQMLKTIQTLNLNKEDIEKLAEQFVEWITKVSYDDAYYMLLFLLGVNNDAEKINNFLSGSEVYWIKAYSKMLEEYAKGTGSMATEAEITANSWEGSLNRLSNTWVDTVGNIADSDAIITIINSLNGLLSVVNNVTEALGSLGTISLAGSFYLNQKNSGGLINQQTLLS